MLYYYYYYYNVFASNYQNQLMCVEVVVCYISVIFWRHSVDISHMHASANAVLKANAKVISIHLFLPYSY